MARDELVVAPVINCPEREAEYRGIIVRRRALAAQAHPASVVGDLYGVTVVSTGVRVTVRVSGVEASSIMTARDIGGGGDLPVIFARVRDILTLWGNLGAARGPTELPRTARFNLQSVTLLFLQWVVREKVAWAGAGAPSGKDVFARFCKTLATCPVLRSIVEWDAVRVAELETEYKRQAAATG